MSETHYLISDASKKVDVESHVLRVLGRGAGDGHTAE